MNPMFRIGLLFGLFVTICKVVTAFIVLPVVGFVAAESSFFYAVAAMMVVFGVTRNIWVLLIALGVVFVVLTGAGV